MTKYIGHLRIERNIDVELEFDGESYRALEAAAVMAGIEQGLILPDDGDRVWIRYVEPARNVIRSSNISEHRVTDYDFEDKSILDDIERSELELEGGGPQ